MRLLAGEVGLSIEEFDVYIKAHPEREYDRKIDEKLREVGLRNGVAIESRLAHGNIPPAFHVLLTCDLSVRAERCKDRREYSGLPVDEVAQRLQKRDTDDLTRFDELYIGHNWNENDYDFVQPTDDENVTPLDRANQIVWEHDKWKLRMIQKGIRIVE